VSPTVFLDGKYRGFFFSREEARMHVHVGSPDGEAKYWLEPILALASHTGLPARELRRMQKLVEEHHGEIIAAWGATSAEVTILGLTPHALWVLVNGREHMLDYARFPWFRDASMRDVLDVRLEFGAHLRWPSLDVDLHLDSLDHPERFPLESRDRSPRVGRAQRRRSHGR